MRTKLPKISKQDNEEIENMPLQPKKKSRLVEPQVGKPAWYIEPINKKEIHHGCLNCGGTEQTLDLETRLYNEFGGWHITRDGEMFFEEEMHKADNWETIKQLKEIEAEALEDPDHDWRAVFNLPLRGGTYQRHDKDKWVLIESNQGFA